MNVDATDSRKKDEMPRYVHLLGMIVTRSFSDSVARLVTSWLKRKFSLRSWPAAIIDGVWIRQAEILVPAVHRRRIGSSGHLGF